MFILFNRVHERNGRTDRKTPHDGMGPTVAWQQSLYLVAVGRLDIESNAIFSQNIYCATYHSAVGHVWFIPDRNAPTRVDSAEARRNAVWIAWTSHRRRAAARRGRPLEPALRSQRHLPRTRVYTSRHLCHSLDLRCWMYQLTSYIIKLDVYRRFPQLLLRF